MKQGPSNSQAGDQKREPISHAVNISSVAEIGIHQVHTGGGSSQALYEGRGFEAPLAGSDSHPHGSQGKH
jgi:hypothetical protein